MKDKIVCTSLRQNSQIKSVSEHGLTLSSDTYILKYIKSNQKFEFAISTNKKTFRKSQPKGNLSNLIF